MNNIEKFGGNEVRRDLKLAGAKEFTFSDSESYTYRCLNIEAGESRKISGFGALTIYCLRLTGTTVNIIGSSGVKVDLEAGDVGQAERMDIEVFSESDCVMLYAGTKMSRSVAPELTQIPAGKVKKVLKPWGFELWLTGEHPHYTFKRIEIKKGTRTSLQYHQLKRETIVLMDGKAKLHYRAYHEITLDLVRPSDVATVDLAGISSIDVMPLTLHRMEAMSDIVLCEVSTPHLDDVVRLSDDSGRTHGRIASEHISR